MHRTLKDRLRSMKGFWTDNVQTSVFDCNRGSSAFFKVFNRTSLPLCDWPVPSDFLSRKTNGSKPQKGDRVAIKDRKPATTIAPRFKGEFIVTERLGNSVRLDDGRQVNLHDLVLVRRS